MTTRSATRDDNWFDEPTPPARDPNRPGGGPPRRRRAGLLAAAALAVAGLLVAGLVVSAAYGERALPGTTVAGVDVGGDDAAEIRRALTGVLAGDAPVRLVAGGRTIEVTPAQAGYAADLDATVQRALNAGRSGPAGTLRGLAGGLLGDREVAPVTRVDPVRLRAVVQDVARQIDRPRSAGAITASAQTLEVQVTAPRDGRTVRRAELAGRLRAALARPRDGAVAVPVTARPAVPAETVQQIAQRAEAYLRKPLLIGAPGTQALTVEPARLAPVLQLRALSDGREARLGTDPQARRALIAELAARRDRPARDVRFGASTTGVTVQGKGDVAWKPVPAEVTVLRAARPGREVRRGPAGDRLDRAVRAGRHTMTLPLRTVRPAVTARDARGVDDLIGTFTTAYAPGQPRVTNIRRIATAVDGTVVAPGGTFSLNDIAGERTESKGYVEAPFIAEGNRLEDSVGGGVSQFSTTMYNAAYFAGLRLDAHTAHSFFIDRYPAGRESTLNWGSIDLRWTNDTRTPVLIDTESTDASVTVRLYGDNGGRRVRAITGERRPSDDGGFAITVTREIRFANGRQVRQPVTTTYGVPAEE